MKEKLKSFTNVVYRNPILVILVVYFIITSVTIPYFFTQRNLTNILIQSTDLIIISCGLMFVLLNGGIDFSIIATMGLGSIIGALIMNTKTGLLANSAFGAYAAIAVMLLIGLVIGGINGLAVVFLKMPSFMATMANYLIFSGFALFLAQSKSIANLPKAFLFIGNGKLFTVIPFPVVITIFVCIIMSIILSRTVFGRSIYAVGTNHATSFISGIPVKRTIFTLFLICGLLAAIGGMITTSRLGAGRPLLNSERLMDFVAAIILGGTSIFGGKGTVSGTILGALFIAVLSNSLGMLGLQWYTIMIIKGAFVLFGAWLDAYKTLRDY
ncbi:MAG: ABC transporter permease [Spirochaetes bacterium]|nr:ABC transporter permease [Spirochaetota bacterium]